MAKKSKIKPLPKAIEQELNRSFTFAKFGLVNLSVLRAFPGTRLSTNELKRRIRKRFAAEMVDGKIGFIGK